MSDNNNMESGSTSIADDFRQRGNHEFQQQQYQNAVSFYTSALEHSNFEQRILNLCNRSACYYQMQDYELSLKDATTAWNVSRQMNVPAAIRLSKSAHKIGDLSTAIATLQRALRILTNDVQLYIQPNQTETAAPDRRVASQQQQQQPPQIQEASTNNTTTSSAPNASAQTKTVTQLLQQLQQEQQQQQQQNSDDTNQASTNTPETSIIGVHRPLSIREFTLSQDLGRGNFSEIIKVQHKVTGQLFALKKIAKKGAADLYKRQHPNVYNEIQMERRLLLERVNDDSGTTHRHPNIIQMYHAFQDYENLYYLMEFIDTDLWSTLRYSAPRSNSNTTSDTTLPIMLGCHRSLCKYWMYELIGAIEFLHSRGIVHRDLKTENILLKGNHVVVIDFGTAKDMVYTDLNGPEFVGTPDFMSPQAVNETETDFGTDLWALGAVLYQMIVGHTPYWSPSQYLAFLKIKRALHYDNLPRVTGIVEDDCWDFIHALMRADPRQRLGAGVFEMQDHVVVQGEANGYDCLRTHPYLQGIHEELQPTSARVFRNKATPVPSLWDCAVRATAEMAYRDSLDLDVCDAHPPGDGSKHDLLRLRRPERNAVLHVLDRRQLLGSEPRLYRRFFAKLPDYVRAATHDVVGLTQMNDDQGKAPKPHDPYSKFAKFEPIVIVQLSNPILCGDDLNEDTRKTYWKLLKRCIAAINKRRPHLVVVSGKMDDKIRKLLARISDTIPVVLHDGSTFLSAWKNGVQVICLNRETSKAQEDWLSEWLEQERMSKHPLFVFVDGNPHQLSRRLLKKLARGRALGLYGVSNDDPVGTELTYVANDTDDDGASIKSTDSNEEEGDEFTMNIQATNENGLRCITVNEEPDDWTSEFQRIELPVSE